MATEVGESGLLIEVRWEWNGTETTAEVAVGATSVTVENATKVAATEEVWIGESGPYTITAVDESSDTIEFAPAFDPEDDLAAPEGEPVVPDVGGAPAQVWVAEVVLTDSETPIEVPLTIKDLSVMPEGVYDPPKAVVVSEDYARIIDLPGSLPAVNGGYIMEGTLPIPDLPVPEAPTTSPALTVYGNPRGFVIEAESVEPTTVLDYHLGTTAGFTPGPTTLLATTRSTVVTVEALPDGSPLNPDATYYVKAIAWNDYGPPAPVGPETEASLRLIDDSAVRELAAGKIVAGDLIGAYALLGALNVGSAISLSVDQGLLISLADGGVIKFPADGSPATITAGIVANWLTVQGSLRILGTDNEIGQGSAVYISNGVTNPATKPTVSYEWPRLKLTFADPEISGALRCIGNENGDGTMTVFAYNGTGSRALKGWLETVNLTTGAVTPQAANFSFPSTAFPYVKTLRKIGSEFFLLVKDPARSNDWYVYVLNSSGSKIREFRAVTSASLYGTTNASPAMEVWNGEIVIGYVPTSRTITFKRFSPTVTGTSPAALGTHALSGYTHPTSYTYGVIHLQAPPEGGLAMNVPSDSNTATQKKWLGVSVSTSSSTAAWYYDATSNYSIAIDNAFSTMKGVQSASPNYDYYNGNLWKYGGKYVSNLTTGNTTANPTISDEFVFTWRDQDTGGTGTHETLASPVAVLAKYPNRATPVVTTPPLPMKTNPDSVDSVRVYSRYQGDAAYMWDRWDGPVGVQTVRADQRTKNGSTQSLPTENTFASANLTPASLLSGGTDSGGANVIALNGDGSGRVGPLAWDKAGKATAGLADTGWVNFTPTKGGSTPFPNTTATTISRARYRRVGDLVSLNVVVTAGAAFNPANPDHGNKTVVTGVPVAARPDQDTPVPCRMGDTPVSVVVQSNGNVVWVGSHSASPGFVAGDVMEITATYFAA